MPGFVQAGNSKSWTKRRGQIRGETCWLISSRRSGLSATLSVTKICFSYNATEFESLAFPNHISVLLHWSTLPRDRINRNKNDQKAQYSRLGNSRTAWLMAYQAKMLFLSSSGKRRVATWFFGLWKHKVSLPLHMYSRQVRCPDNSISQRIVWSARVLRCASLVWLWNPASI